jgi:glyoxylase-like metal-dependent hydrolase (beta-lactamase superfamily II)
MLKLHAFTFNPFSENTYIIYNAARQCWIVDPGMNSAEEESHFFDFIDAEGLAPVAILNTHAHLDHIFGVQACKDRYSIPFSIHAAEELILRNAAVGAAMFGVHFPNVPQQDSFIEERKTLLLGEEDRVEVLLTPGHSPGSVCFYSVADGWLIGGDVLFAGSIGRTDLPGGHHATLLESIRTQLLPLPDDTRVYSGHGPSTTIAAERRSNPWLQG